MPLFAFEDREPDVSPGAWIGPTATLVEDVRVEAEASIWYGAVLRADFGPIVVRAGANVQDGSILHGGSDPVTEVGEGATIGHRCVVHGAIVRTEALIGNGATVLDGAIVGCRALVAAGCTVPPGMTIPDGMLAVGSRPGSPRDPRPPITSLTGETGLAVGTDREAIGSSFRRDSCIPGRAGADSPLARQEEAGDEFSSTRAAADARRGGPWLRGGVCRGLRLQRQPGRDGHQDGHGHPVRVSEQ